MIWIWLARLGQSWLISWRSRATICGIESVRPAMPCSGACRRFASDSLPGSWGYQCTSAKSSAEQVAWSTLSFQAWSVPALPRTSSSGQLPGAVSATPTLTDGSTAFMASMNCSALAP